jgi:hypothetical protein
LLLFISVTALKEINPKATRISKGDSSGTVGEGLIVGLGVFAFVGF